MAGLENIIDQIRQEAENAARLTRETAEGEAAKILAEAREKAARIEEDGRAKAAKETDDIRSRYESMARTAGRQAVLSARRDEIALCLDKAKEAVLAQDAPAYFAMLERQIGARAAAKAGQVILSPADRKRMPADFAAHVADIAKKAGGSLTVSEETRPIEGGFILVYGGIEENASVEALCEEYADELSDTVAGILFP